MTTQPAQNEATLSTGMEVIQTSHYLSGLLPTLASDCSVSSAGVGRTGTYIVLDWSLHVIHEKDELNIFQIVCTLREHRVLMVQTEVSVALASGA